MTKPYTEITGNILPSMAGDNNPLMLPKLHVNNELFEKLKSIRFLGYY